MTDPDVLGILLTGKCNLVCRHCCNESHPKNQSVVQIQEIRRLIDEAKSIRSIREIGFSGGEPFLFESLLLDAVAYARESGFGSSITTNGYWGRSSRGPRLLAALKNQGLSGLAISTSVFHREFVDIGTVAAAAEAGLAARLDVVINVVESADLNEEVVRAELGKLADRLRFVVMPLLPTGRAASEIASDQYQSAFSRPLGNCARHFRKLAVDVAGNVYPCCSPGGFTPALRIGGIDDKSLAEIVRDRGINPLISILDSVGPAFFLPFVRAAGADADLPDSFVDQCHLCHAMLSSPAAAAVVTEMSGQLMAELAITDEDELDVAEPLRPSTNECNGSTMAVAREVLGS
ncbi:MAG TPA: radical SAM protein [Allosphingosinicella sp.]